MIKKSNILFALHNRPLTFGTLKIHTLRYCITIIHVGLLQTSTITMCAEFRTFTFCTEHHKIFHFMPLNSIVELLIGLISNPEISPATSNKIVLFYHLSTGLFDFIILPLYNSIAYFIIYIPQVMRVQSISIKVVNMCWRKSRIQVVSVLVSVPGIVNGLRGN